MKICRIDHGKLANKPNMAARIAELPQFAAETAIERAAECAIASRN